MIDSDHDVRNMINSDHDVRNMINPDHDVRNMIDSDHIYIYIITSVYSPFSDRVGLPLHNIHIPSPLSSIMDIFFVDLKFGHIRFYTL